MIPNAGIIKIGNLSDNREMRVKKGKIRIQENRVLPKINLQLRNKKMLRNESCDPLKIDAAVLQVSKPV